MSVRKRDGSTASGKLVRADAGGITLRTPGGTEPIAMTDIPGSSLAAFLPEPADAGKGASLLRRALFLLAEGEASEARAALDRAAAAGADVSAVQPLFENRQ